MRHKLLIFVILFFAAWLCLTGAAGENHQASDIDTNIKRAAKYLLDRQPDPGKECKDGVYYLLEAVVQSLPHAGYPEEVDKKIIAANQRFKKNRGFDIKGIQWLHEAYRSINDGKEFQMPSISTIGDAVEHGRKLLDAARQKIKEKDFKFAAKVVLEATLMVFTPVQE